MAPEYVDSESHDQNESEERQAAEELVAEGISSRLLAVRKRRHALESKLRYD